MCHYSVHFILYRDYFHFCFVAGIASFIFIAAILFLLMLLFLAATFLPLRTVGQYYFIFILLQQLQPQHIVGPIDYSN